MSTTFFNYDDLTWDAVAELPRDVPLVLPLGSGYDLSLLASQLSNPPRIGLLPPFPFGWLGSGLEVPDQIFAQYFFNLLDSLRDDGFSRVYCLASSGFDPQTFFVDKFSSSILRLPSPAHNAPQSFLPPYSERGKVILIPIGHTEQHGFHLLKCLRAVMQCQLCRMESARIARRLLPQ